MFHQRKIRRTTKTLSTSVKSSSRRPNQGSSPPSFQINTSKSFLSTQVLLQTILKYSNNTIPGTDQMKDVSRELLELITSNLFLELKLGLNKKKFSELKFLGLKLEFLLAV